MAKQRYALSKKHEYMIDKLCEIPSLNDIKSSGLFKDMQNGFHTDFRYNTEDILLMVLENITKGTQQEDVAKEICKKARAVFDYYSEM